MNTISAAMLAKMVIAGAKSLENKKDWINELNVFPVPDGDTGTNMTMTIMSAAKELIHLEDDNDMKAVCKAISSGSLRGARGNSGVILSQLLRGFTKVAIDYNELNVDVIVEALDKAVETAYKAVMKPKEGTILTVAKGIATKAATLYEEGVLSLDEIFPKVITYGEEVLAKTPDMLPVLKEAGVVDSGGQGLIEVLKGVYDCFLGKEIDMTVTEVKPVTDHDMGTGAKYSNTTSSSYKAQAEADIKYGYCTEFIILLNRTFNIKNEIDFKEFLESIGDSIVLVADDEVVKIHVHTNDPGLALQRALKYGQLSNIKIDNMRIEHQEKLFKMEQGAVSSANSDTSSETASNGMPVNESKEPSKEFGFVAIAAGDGLAEIFKGVGADYVISGGQTMNPSTEDILEAAKLVDARHIFVLPNNKNIIMAANQAADISEDKQIHVIPTKTIPQGITAILNFMPDASVSENIDTMNEMIAGVSSGEITYAVRDTMIDNTQIHTNDFMGIGDKGLLAVTDDINKTTLESIEKMMTDSAELISLYYGEDVKEEDAESIREQIEKKYPSCDVELQYGGQPVYYYILSVE